MSGYKRGVRLTFFWRRRGSETFLSPVSRRRPCGLSLGVRESYKCTSVREGDDRKRRIGICTKGKGTVKVMVVESGVKRRGWGSRGDRFDETVGRGTESLSNRSTVD